MNCSVRRKILNMFEKLWRMKFRLSFVTMRFNTFFNRTSSYSVRQLALEIAAVSKFAYRVQLICISSEQERISAIICELQRKFANRSELNQTHERELKRPETNGIRIYANNYEPDE